MNWSDNVIKVVKVLVVVIPALATAASAILGGCGVDAGIIALVGTISSALVVFLNSVFLKSASVAMKAKNEEIAELKAAALDAKRAQGPEEHV